MNNVTPITNKPIALMQSVLEYPHKPEPYTAEHRARIEARMASGEYVCLTDRSTYQRMQEQDDE